jgi:hypothetical protein
MSPSGLVVFSFFFFLFCANPIPSDKSSPDAIVAPCFALLTVLDDPGRYSPMYIKLTTLLPWIIIIPRRFPLLKNLCSTPRNPRSRRPSPRTVEQLSTRRLCHLTRCLGRRLVPIPTQDIQGNIPEERGGKVILVSASRPFHTFISSPCFAIP